jgi:hypothetical protein
MALALAGAQQPANGISGGGGDGRPPDSQTAIRAVGTGTRHAAHYPLADHAALELGDQPEHETSPVEVEQRA